MHSILKDSNSHWQSDHAHFSTHVTLTSFVDPFFENQIFDPESLDEPLFPAEQAYDRLFTLLLSNSPWRVTSEFLFSICHILEDSLAFPPTPSPAPISLTLIPVLRTMRVWRLQPQEERNLDRLASDLAGLVDVELSAAANRTDKSNLKRDTRTRNDYARDDLREEDDKENVNTLLAPASHGRPHARRNSKNIRPIVSCSHNLPDEPNPPHFRHKCAACAMLLSSSKPKTATKDTRRYSTANDTNPHPSLPRMHATPLGSLVQHDTNLDSRKPFLLTSHQDSFPKPPRKQKSVTPSRTLTSMNGGIPRSQTVSSAILASLPPVSPAGFEDDMSLSEVWIKRRSQEDGWRP